MCYHNNLGQCACFRCRMDPFHVKQLLHRYIVQFVLQLLLQVQEVIDDLNKNQCFRKKRWRYIMDDVYFDGSQLNLTAISAMYGISVLRKSIACVYLPLR